MQRMFTSAQPMPAACCLPKPESAEYDWRLSERGLLNIASGEDAQGAQVDRAASGMQTMSSAASSACPRERGEAACGGCKCA